MLWEHWSPLTYKFDFTFFRCSCQVPTSTSIFRLSFGSLGPMSVKRLYSEEEWTTCNWRKILAVRNSYSGSEYSIACISDLGWGRGIFMNNGETFIFGLPLQTLLMSFCKAHGKSNIEDIPEANLASLGDFFSKIPCQVFMEMGGFHMYARKGQGIVIPPMFMVGFINAFLFDNPFTAEMAGVTPGDILVPWSSLMSRVSLDSWLDSTPCWCWRWLILLADWYFVGFKA